MRRLLVRLLNALERWLDSVAQPKVTLTREQHIGELAGELLQKGYTAVSALAVAEALVVGQEHGLRFDRVELDNDLLQWFGIYETGPHRHPTIVKVPLEHASAATQAGIGSLN